MIISVIGARPQFVKAAVVSRALARYGIDEAVVHTGQHYDDDMSGRLLRELGINNIIANLGSGSGPHAQQTANIMIGMEQLIQEHRHSVRGVLVYGDTNSSIAAALAAAKLNVPIAHVEAGLRSFNRQMPEEINRIVVDHLASTHFCSSPQGVEQLRREGIDRSVYDVGDVMLDAFQSFSRHSADYASIRPSLKSMATPFVLLTVHRPSNTDDTDRFEQIITQLGGTDRQFVWPVHPRTRSQIEGCVLPKNIQLETPFSYLETLEALSHCNAVVTDSGGLQKEAYWAKKPCLTLRDETEWAETLEGGWNQLCNPQHHDLSRRLETPPSHPWKPLYGDGSAADRIADVLGSDVLRTAA